MMVLEKGGEGWRPAILVPENPEEDLARVADRLHVDLKAMEGWKKKKVDYAWDNKLRRLVEKDGTLNMVSKRRLYHWAVWEYKSLMRYSWFSLLLWCITIYVCILLYCLYTTSTYYIYFISRSSSPL